MEMNDSDSVSQYRYLWDGSQPGWTLVRIYGERVELALAFSAEGPSTREVMSIRKVVPTFKSMPLSEVIEQLRGQQIFMLGQFETREARTLRQSCSEEGLTVTQKVNDVPRYILANELTNRALIIDDDELAKQVHDAALRHQIPVRHVET
jgi:hypothetical protein